MCVTSGGAAARAGRPGNFEGRFLLSLACGKWSQASQRRNPKQIQPLAAAAHTKCAGKRADPKRSRDASSRTRSRIETQFANWPLVSRSILSSSRATHTIWMQSVSAHGRYHIGCKDGQRERVSKAQRRLCISGGLRHKCSLQAWALLTTDLTAEI